jgi:hypothetical protein
MFLRHEDIAAVVFSKNKRESTFFSRDDEYYYTHAGSFRVLFQNLVFQMKIIRPEILQKGGHFLNPQKEREKIIIMERAIKMAPNLLDDYNKELFIGRLAPNMGLADYFYIKKESKILFIKKILHPLLNMIKNCDKKDWKRIRGQRGFWREMEKDEPMPVGGEVSMNLTTGKKMIRL